MEVWLAEVPVLELPEPNLMLLWKLEKLDFLLEMTFSISGVAPGELVWLLVKIAPVPAMVGSC